MAPSWGPSGPGDTGEDAGPTLDDRPGLGGVTETRRRNTIVSLVNNRHQSPYTIGELTVDLAAWFRDETDGMVPTDEEIHSILYDFDLPHLDSTNQVVFDRETGCVCSMNTSDRTAGKTFDEETAETKCTTETATNGDGGSEVDILNTERVQLSVKQLVNFSVLLFGVMCTAITASSSSPFDTPCTLVPAVLVVCFFGYRGATY
ncbi:hypothetical protein E6P09_17085 (plasmid) [Haloferax mediterranei ATCC 33500]|uniref:DUF7344 domain-containing protein n=1 Tax=Haloferax mediterranei (strain ATCC 33500 / DSM 1411 / JCM 8866 / NBRC 14739 / NCIMB 2177 / R-4) TaxID=523841 RepID=I3RAL5_HALMT|nr:hypothetical protein [Haloferax mediterranei]AFK21275.1 hypothetical protein HFX_6151 [Haloferax mediterranei ATCC 33500]AHZ24626.1 hypothetical protein BM92_17170 [Haloferax mediterranei ATCC 33500]ELZ97393.1 hypothetical protein C439_18763 [Haloferax mediterranei ATCC 33500]MDX5990311.1 hypothetical protein [Haloferax mediterranei ATCC 33500]QCQ77023.1 hypothetical protein E6P09_17085 [Haloferax mediterranei ATCC 33500]